MDWLEQWFGLNPDGGRGTMEAALVVALVAMAVAVAAVLHRPTRRRLGEAARRLGYSGRVTKG